MLCSRCLLRTGQRRCALDSKYGVLGSLFPSWNKTFEEGRCAGGLLPRVGVGLTHFGSLEILCGLKREPRRGALISLPASWNGGLLL